MGDFSDMLRRSLDAADYLIRAANTQDAALRQRLTFMAEDLLGEAEVAAPNESATGRSKVPVG